MPHSGRCPAPARTSQQGGLLSLAGARTNGEDAPIAAVPPPIDPGSDRPEEVIRWKFSYPPGNPVEYPLRFLVDRT
jgi:hypothetical protein